MIDTKPRSEYFFYFLCCS